MNPTQKPVRLTIKEVASKAGVSTQTISRVINERPDVSPETRERVQEVIKKLGYRPSALARSLIRQRSHTLGVVTAGLQYIGPSRTLSGIAIEAEVSGYSLLLKELSRFDDTDVEPIFQELLSRHVDGIIWAVPEVGNNHAWINQSALDIGVPLVYLTMEKRSDLSIVSVDNYVGGRMAMAHLLEQGYRTIGHISGPVEWWEARQRMLAWKDALEEVGLDASSKYCVEGNWSSASGLAAVEKLYIQYPQLDAIFVANDQMALGAMQFLIEKQICIPDDIGIIGFDNIAESAFFSPALTTIQQDQNSVAKVAVEELIKIIESGWQKISIVPRSVILPPALVVRKSSLQSTKGGDTRSSSNL